MSRQGIKDIPAICSRQGIAYAILTPGSRNAPLILSFVNSQTIKCLSITDERSAAYFATGMTQATGAPVALVCTSGTAVLNMMPAVAEAFYQNLPLVVFTADRPPEWIDQADGQTIRQREVFRNHVKASFELPVDTSHEDALWYSNRTISQAVGLSMRPPAGPVHINVPLREPLYKPLPDNISDIKHIETITPLAGISKEHCIELAETWNRSAKKMIVCGFMKPSGKLAKILVKLSEREDTVVIAENLSNLHGQDFIYAPERFFASLGEAESAIFRPVLLITLGNSVVSKKLKQFLRSNKPDEHWHVDSGNLYVDTYQSLTRNIPVMPEVFFSSLEKYLQLPLTGISYAHDIKERENTLAARHFDYFNNIDFSDLQAFEHILKAIPPGSNLHLANSTAVRHAQLFPSRSDLAYFSNRGTSGIDGCLSAAAGSAFVSGKPTTLIAGDLAFIYDSNGLWNNYLNKNFRIIVINNGGGNIFRLIETAGANDGAIEFFETPHHVNIENLVRAFGLTYYFSDNISSLKAQLVNFYIEDGPSVLEVKTQADVNVKVFKDYFKKMKSDEQL